MRRNTRRIRRASGARLDVAAVTFTAMLGAGTIGGVLVARGTAPMAAWAESGSHACEHNQCSEGKMCVDSESAPVATRCDAIGQGGECVTLPCGAKGATILNLIRFPSSESGDQLVALGPEAVSAVLGYAGLAEPYPERSHALKTLAQMVEVWQVKSFDQQDVHRLHGLARLYLGPSPSHLDTDERVPVAAGAIDLALALNDPELRSVVELIASSTEEARARLGSQVDYGQLTTHARSRLGID